MERGQYFEFHNPVKILAGRGALGTLSVELERLGSHRPMLVTDKGVRSAGLVDILLKAAGESALAFGAIFDEVPPDSGTLTVAAAAAAYRAKSCDGIVAVGGGSVIDTAKAVNILVAKGGDDLVAYSGAGTVTGRLSPFIVVPTTAGTGSECTLVAVVRDDARQRKLSFVSASLLPDAAVLDPRMTLTLPPLVTAATGMDALTHAIEASYCIGKNPLSDAYADLAITLVSRRLVEVVKNPGDAQGRLDLALASTMAGIAFSNSMVGLVHSLGHAAGGVCHVAHGVAMSIFLPHVLEYNFAKRRDGIGALLYPLAGAEACFAVPESGRAEAVVARIRGLQEALHGLAGLPRTLSETGKVDRRALPDIARAAINDASIAYNPEEAGFEDCLRLLEKAY
jgi:alcohol dehydrogenase